MTKRPEGSPSTESGAGSAWLRHYRRELSPLGEDVADILGRAFSGIYHIEREVLHRRVKWESESCILITIRRELSTHDGDELMKLVVGCADRGIRFALRGAAPEYLRLQFTRGRLMFFGTVKAMHEVLT